VQHPIEQLRIKIASTLLDKAFDCYFADLEPKTVYSYLPKFVTRRAAWFLAEKVAQIAQKGRRRNSSRSEQIPNFTQWGNLLHDSTEIRLNIFLHKSQPPSP